ncbi:MAG: hypothetical protein P4M11_05660 [Candidatus Pacebacteria bacterium]|nr:hypothetical protein [Candidatus Paceibacterota bacterium]
MEDALDISWEKKEFHMTKTADGRETGYIRWGMIEGNDGQPKQLAFYISLLDAQFAQAAGKSIAVESDAIVKRAEVLDGPQFQAYEWVNTEFESVPADEQTWFGFH